MQGIHVRRSFFLVLSLSTLACLPPPQDAGEVDEPTGSSGQLPPDETSTGDPTNTSGDSVDEPEWSLELEPGTTINQMVRSPSGVVLVLQSDPTAPEATVMEISSTMDPLWSIDLPTAWVSDLAALDDGTYVMAGVSAPLGTPVPTAWRLSCCGNLDQAVEFPTGDELSGFVVSQPLAEGLLLAHSNGTQTEVMRTTLDLVTQWSSTLPFYAHGGAPTSTGTVLLAGTEGGSATLIYEIEADRPGLGMSNGQNQYPVGAGPELVLMTAGYEQVWFQPHDGGAVVAVPLPGFTGFEYVADRKERFGLAFSVTEDTGSTAHVAEFAADGAVLREVVVPPLSLDYVTASAIVVGTDDAIYLGTYEITPGNSVIPRLYRFAPL